MDTDGTTLGDDQETGERPTVVCTAGFGDNGTMFAPLLRTQAGVRLRIDPFDLPGFGAPALAETSLETLANALDERCRAISASTVVAHSVASIIASLAARRHGSPIRTIVSLEGNLTPEDAYFSGTAADYDDPGSFRAAFLGRLDEMGTGDPIIRGYRERVAGADPLALWHLGRSARRFSDENDPGAVLIDAASATYVFNPENCPAASLAWLDRHDVRRVVLDGASHWPTIDRATDVANVITDTAAKAEGPTD